MRWKRIALVGVGLLGGSLGLALKQRRMAESVVGFVRRAASISECRKAGAVDFATRDVKEAVEGADLVILCTPIAQMRPLLEQMLPGLKPGTIITDVGSVKANVVRELEPLAAKAGAHFVGSHPMAGSEKTGVSAASGTLFVDAVCVVTPTRKSDKAAVVAVEQLWKGVGGRLLQLAPEEHDALVSRSSHLPHVLAATLVNLVLSRDFPKEQGLLCANGFRDTTRVASGSPEMWRDIALANHENISRSLDAFIRNLQHFRRVLEAKDIDAIARFFEDARQKRDKWAVKASSPSPE